MDPVDQMMQGENPANQSRRAATINEMQRRANDRIRVYNPTDEDYKVAWDITGAGGIWTIPSRTKNTGFGNGQLVVLRYVAINYVKHMTDKILGDKAIQAVREENKRRIDNRMRPMEIYGGTPESQEIFENKFRIDNEDQRRQIFNILWVGVEEEYAANQPTQEVSPTYDPRGLDERILDSINKTAKPLTDFPTLDILDGKETVQTPVVEVKTLESDQGVNNTKLTEDFSSMNFMKLKQLAKSRGIEVDLKTKKDELLEKLQQQ